MLLTNTQKQLVRPEFQAFLENEQKTLSLVKDVADSLDNLSANPLHTPALYSGFLRALISAKLDPVIGLAAGETKGPPQSDPDPHPHLSSNDMPPPSTNNNHMAYANEPSFNLNEFQFDSEMGPVADISTFPPTMAPNPSEDTFGSLTMENILSSGFWDSVLVPGKLTTVISRSSPHSAPGQDITVWMA